MALNIAPANGEQTTTQNPQTSPTGAAPGASTKSSGVQPGTSNSLLTSTQGESLRPQALTTVSLVNTGTQTRTLSRPTPQPAPHKLNPAWISIPVILCVAAAIMFWAMTRSAKNTTD